MKMDTETKAVDPSEINKNPDVVIECQKEISVMDVLICGKCHEVYHFLEEFLEHRNSGECKEQSKIREGNINEPKAQVWAFLLWKNTQNKVKAGTQKPTDKDNSWLMYQKWCKLETDERNMWIIAGKHVQGFTKLGATKLQFNPIPLNKKLLEEAQLEEGEIRVPKLQTPNTKLTTVRTVVKTEQLKQKNVKLEDEYGEDSDEDEDIDSESDLDTEEEAELAEIEQEAMQQRKKNATNNTVNKPVIKVVTTANIANTITNTTTNNSIQNKPSENTSTITKPLVLDRKDRMAKRTGKISTEGTIEIVELPVEKILAKRYNPRKRCHEYLLKWESQPHEQNTWESTEHMSTCKLLLEEFEKNLAKQKEKKAAQAAAESQLKKLTPVAPKPPIQTPPVSSTGRPVRNSKIRALGQVKAWCGSMFDDESGKRKSSDNEMDDDVVEKKSKRDGADGTWSVGESNTSTINGSDVDRKSDKKTGTQPVLVAHAKGIVNVHPNQSSNFQSGVYVISKDSGLLKVVNDSTNLNNKPCIMRVKPNNSSSQSAQVRVVQKGDTQQSGIVRMSAGTSPAVGQKGSIATQRPVISPQKRIVGQQNVRLVQRKPPIAGKTTVFPGKAKESRLAPGNSLHMEFHTTSDESSEDDLPDLFPKDLPPPVPDSPPRPLTLCPLTGKVLGRAEGERTPDPSPPPTEVCITSNSSEQATTLATLVSTADINKSSTVQVATTTANETDIILNESGELASDAPLMITGEDGTIYQVAGQDENGQTLLVAQGTDGEQQCVYLAAGSEDSEGNILGIDPDSAVTMSDDSVAQLVSDEQTTAVEQPLVVNTDGDESQVVAQVVKADLPSPGGTRKVVLLLQNGTLAVTTFDAAQYSALELE